MSTRTLDFWFRDNTAPLIQGPLLTSDFGYYTIGGAPVVQLDGAPVTVFVDKLLPLEFQTGVPVVLLLNWLAGGGGAPVWWREIPTPAYVPQRPADHLRDRTRRRRRREVPPARRVLQTEAIAELEELDLKAIAEVVAPDLGRLRSALATLMLAYARPRRPGVLAEVDLVESDEEFLIITGQL